jgi:hypothetical protein
LIVAAVAGVLVWWAWKQGAYFGTVFFPGAILIFGLLFMLLLAAPLRARFAGPVRIALAAILALAAWTLLSILWSSSQDAALQDAERVMLYAALFLLGIWSCNLSGRRMLIPLAAVAATGAVIGVVITVTLAGGTDVPSFFHSDATLRFPIGYRNAEGAFLLICLWPVITLAAEGELPWPVRALLVGTATMLMELAVLAESRGSLPAAVIALAVFLALSPRRLRAATYLALAAVPVLPVLPILLDVFQHGAAGPGLVPLMRDSARAIALSSIGSVVLAALLVRGVEFRLDLSREAVALISRVTAAAAIVVVVAGGAIFVERRGGPIEFLDQRVSEFQRGGNPDLTAQGARFGVNVGTNRGDFWHVSLQQGEDHPILGGGAGSFAPAYLQDRDSTEAPNDPHSVEMLMLSELGIVGLALFGTFMVGSAVCGVRTWRLGAPAAALAAGSLTSAAYWLAHASYDWFWHYPALTAPVMFMLGAVAAPSSFYPAAGRARRARYLAAAAVGVAIVLAVPLFLSQRYANRAYDEYPQDPDAALSDLDRAADLNPYDPRPLLSKGVIESQLDHDEAAASAFRKAIDRAPDGYAGHFFLARALADTDRAAARAAADEALRLNPLGRQVRRLAASLEGRRGP